MRKLLIALLAALLALSCAALAEETAFTFAADTGTITAYNGAGGDVTVPAQIGDTPVRALRFSVFNSMEGMTGVALPDTLEVIDDNNFMDCKGLTEITVPARVAFIGYGCFCWCDDLKSVTFLGQAPLFGSNCFSVLPDDFVCYVPDDQYDAYRAAIDDYIDVQPSGQNAIAVDWTAPESDFTFDAATGTITAYLGDSARVDVPATIGGAPVTAIGDGAFMQNQAIRLVNLPEGVERIGSAAFKYAYELYHVSLPDSLKSIGDEAFAAAWNGMDIRWPASLESIGANAFNMARFMELDFTGRALTIGDGAFARSSVQELYMDDSGISIGSRAFENSYLNYLCIDAYALMDGIAPDAFAGASYLADLDLPWDCSQENQLAWRAFMAEQAPDCYVWINNPPDCGHPENEYTEYGTYPDGTLYLASYTGPAEALVNWHTFDDVPITGIGDGVFRGNQTLKLFRATHSDKFTTIGAEAFADSAVETVDLYYTTETIGAGAFRNCLGLTELTLPASVASVGEGAFDGCDNLARVIVLCDPAALPDNAFANCAALCANPAGVVLPAGASDADVARLSDGMGLPPTQRLLRAGEEAAVQLVAMPFEPTDPALFEIDAETGAITDYYGADADVVVPREIGGVTVRAIGYNAFGRCRDYTDTEVVTNQTSWTHLRSIVLPETVTEIADSAFSYCQQLETFVCYGPAVSTGKGTFLLCRSLREVIFVNGVGMIDNYAFNDTPSFETFYSPAPLSWLGERAFVNSGLSAFVVDANTVGNCAFTYCENLAELHFTENVKAVNYAVVSDCPNLKTVCYEGFDLSFIYSDGIIAGARGEVAILVPEGIDEDNKARAARSLVWGSEATATVAEGACGREIAALPDIEAILAGYAANPYASPEPIGEPEPLPAELPPLDAAAAEPFLGVWYGASMTAEGMTMNLADMGMEMAIALNADGTAEVFSDGESQPGAGSVADGVALLGVDGDTTPLTLADGALVIDMGDGSLTFTREQPEASSYESSPEIAVVMSAFMGHWAAASIEIDGVRYPAELLFGDEAIALDIADGAVTSDDSTAAAYIENGRLIVGEPLDVTLAMHEDGTISADKDDVIIYFTRSENGAPEPAPAPVDPEPVPVPEPVPAAASAIGVKYVCVSYEASGYTFDAAMLGAEYSIVFEENGAASFTLAGQAVPGLTWTQDGDAFTIIYFDGTPMRFEPTETGFQLDYFGAMLLNFEPEA